MATDISKVPFRWLTLPNGEQEDYPFSTSESGQTVNQFGEPLYWGQTNPDAPGYPMDVLKVEITGPNEKTITFRDGKVQKSEIQTKGDTWGSFLQWAVPAALAAGTGYVGGGLAGLWGAPGAAGAGGAASGAGAIGADLAGLGGLTTEGALTAAELGAGSTYGGLAAGAGGAGLTGAGAGAFAVDQSLALAAVEAVAPTADAASKINLLQTVLQQAAASGAKWTAQDYLAAATLGLTAISTIGAMGQGGQTTSATTTKTPTGPGSNIVPGTDKTAADMTFEEYIDDVFNTSGTGLKERIAADQAALTGYQKSLLDTLSGLDTERLTGTKTAVKPFQEQLQRVLDMEKTGTGYYKPFNYSFGGTPMPSFVPKTSLATMNTALGQGRESASLGTSLVDQAYNAGVGQAQRQYGFQSENLPNKAATQWTQELEKMMKYFNPTGQTETTTGEVPGVPWTTTLLQGLTTGTNLWNSIYNPRNSNAELLNALRLLGQGG